MTLTEWAPGDPVYQRDAERGVCADPLCDTTWFPPDDVDECPRCGGPPKDPREPLTT